MAHHSPTLGSAPWTDSPALTTFWLRATNGMAAVAPLPRQPAETRHSSDPTNQHQFFRTTTDSIYCHQAAARPQAPDPEPEPQPESEPETAPEEDPEQNIAPATRPRSRPREETDSLRTGGGVNPPFP